MKNGQIMTLRAANGFEIPYQGYLELTVEVDKLEVPSCGILVLKDTPATTRQRRDVPGLLGTNILSEMAPSLVPSSESGLMPSLVVKKTPALLLSVLLERTLS